LDSNEKMERAVKEMQKGDRRQRVMGLSRPTTSCFAVKKDVDARDKRGHDGERCAHKSTLYISGTLSRHGRVYPGHPRLALLTRF
jgi:hypothetical protein